MSLQFLREMPFLLLSTALLVCVYRQEAARSTASLIEVFLLVVFHWYDPTVTFFSYFTAKLLVSFFAFLFLFEAKKLLNSSKRITNHLGFKSDEYHAQPGLSTEDSVLHYAFPRHPTDTAAMDKDQSWGLVPREEHVSVDDNCKSNWKVRCGLVDEDAANSKDVLKLLESCGRCHNWALITIYEISTDKFLPLATLSLLRWEVWTLIVFFVAAGPVLCFDEENGFKDLLGPALDTLFLALAIFDCLNMNSARLHARRKVTRRSLQNFAKLVVLLLVWFVYVYSVMKPFGVTGSFQFLLLLLLSLTITLLMNYVILPRPLKH